MKRFWVIALVLGTLTPGLVIGIISCGGSSSSHNAGSSAPTPAPTTLIIVGESS